MVCTMVKMLILRHSNFWDLAFYSHSKRLKFPSIQKRLCWQRPQEEEDDFLVNIYCFSCLYTVLRCIICLSIHLIFVTIIKCIMQVRQSTGAVSARHVHKNAPNTKYFVVRTQESEFSNHNLISVKWLALLLLNTKSQAVREGGKEVTLQSSTILSDTKWRESLVFFCHLYH